jgi:isopentenyl diphosphate isomerase/L-lactate dehydrogenase-like FMN-dependent dehydrogenase
MDPFTDPPGYHDPTQSWEDIAKLQKLAPGVPIYLKGVCHIDVSGETRSYLSEYA